MNYCTTTEIWLMTSRKCLLGEMTFSFSRLKNLFLATRNFYFRQRKKNLVPRSRKKFFATRKKNVCHSWLRNLENISVPPGGGLVGKFRVPPATLVEEARNTGLSRKYYVLGIKRHFCMTTCTSPTKLIVSKLPSPFSVQIPQEFLWSIWLRFSERIEVILFCLNGVQL